MTYELAEYFRIMLLCGYEEEYDAFLEGALAQQEPLSEVILELALCGSDEKKAISVLHAYIREAPDGKTDYAEVADRVRGFLRERYEEKSMSVKELAELMRRLALASGNSLEEEPWWTMYTMWECCSEVEAGYLDRDGFYKSFEGFLLKGTSLCISDVAPARPLRTLLWRWLGRRKRK